MRPYKVTMAPPFDTSSMWHGLYYHGGHWREVRNDRGVVIVYRNAKDAMSQAKLIAAELKKEAGK